MHARSVHACIRIIMCICRSYHRTTSNSITDYKAPQHNTRTLSFCLAIVTFSSGHLLISNVPSLRMYISSCVSMQLRYVRAYGHVHADRHKMYLGRPTWKSATLGTRTLLLGTDNIGTTERAWLIMLTKDCCLDQIDFTWIRTHHYRSHGQTHRTR